MTKTVSTSLHTTPDWHRTHGTYIAGRSYVDGADETALEMERKWGRGRLRLLVEPELRDKFDRQRYLFNQAVWHGDLEAVRRESGRMVKAWLALDRAAESAGKRPADKAVLEAVLKDGTVVAIVPDAHAFDPDLLDGRKVQVYTLEEIARLLEGYPQLARVKAAFPGATVTEVRRRGDPLDAFPSSAPDLDTPFVDDSVDELVFGA